MLQNVSKPLRKRTRRVNDVSDWLFQTYTILETTQTWQRRIHISQSNANIFKTSGLGFTMAKAIIGQRKRESLQILPNILLPFYRAEAGSEIFPKKPNKPAV